MPAKLVKKTNTLAAKKKLGRVNNKASAKKALKSKKASKPKKSSKPVKESKEAKEETKKQVKKVNNKPSSFDVSGIGIGPPRVRAVLMKVALNPEEAKVREALSKAANRPAKVKPTKENPNPKQPKQGPQIKVRNLPKEVLVVVDKAEESHTDTLRSHYERDVLAGFSDKERAKYQAGKKAALKEGKTLKEYNLSFNKAFYSKFKNFLKDNDNYVLGGKYDEWSRASALVNKLCTRLSGNTRSIVAAYLDCIVEQYTKNGIYNCLKEKRKIVQLRHALTQTEGFEKRVPLDQFVKTFKTYDNALCWVEEFSAAREHLKKLKAEDKPVDNFELPAYPETDDQYDFSGYVGEICRSIKNNLTKEDLPEPDIDATNISVSKEFRRFGSYLVYEAILRIGKCLAASVKRSNVKTVSDTSVWHTLDQIHNVCGSDFEPIRTTMVARLDKYEKWLAQRKKLRQDARKEDTEVDVDLDATEFD